MREMMVPMFAKKVLHVMLFLSFAILAYCLFSDDEVLTSAAPVTASAAVAAAPPAAPFPIDS
ncbi:UNVERIFIED_ORG: hypothetical protein BDU10_6873 [Burkholderia sp. CF145]